MIRMKVKAESTVEAGIFSKCMHYAFGYKENDSEKRISHRGQSNK